MLVVYFSKYIDDVENSFVSYYFSSNSDFSDIRRRLYKDFFLTAISRHVFAEKWINIKVVSIEPRLTYRDNDNTTLQLHCTDNTTHDTVSNMNLHS